MVVWQVFDDCSSNDMDYPILFKTKEAGVEFAKNRYRYLKCTEMASFSNSLRIDFHEDNELCAIVFVRPLKVKE